VAAPLLAWFAQARRPLPWRERYDPYAVWISEMMLQQTQVETVLPYYRRWMERFPTLRSVAAAPLEAVLKAWEGLGYYARARNLHRAARMVVERHGGAFPDTMAGLIALPGIGPYTAGAIASIAFNRPVALVDGNVARVLSRLFAVGESPRSPAGRQRLWHLAEAALPPKQPGAFNEALMELGALICRPRAPKCLLCPLRGGCQARLSGDPERFPARAARKARPVRRGVLLLALQGERLLVRRRPPGGLWGGLWEFPWTERQAEESPRETVRRLAREMGLPNRPAAKAGGAVSHGLTHFQLELDCFVLAVASRSARPAGADARWVTREEWGALALGRLHHKALELLPDG
jgi:A/G-specific adenine glycosylase